MTGRKLKDDVYVLLGCTALNCGVATAYFKVPADEFPCFRRVNNIINKPSLSSVHRVTEFVLVFLFLAMPQPSGSQLELA